MGDMTIQPDNPLYKGKRGSSVCMLQWWLCQCSWNSPSLPAQAAPPECMGQTADTPVSARMRLSAIRRLGPAPVERGTQANTVNRVSEGAHCTPTYRLYTQNLTKQVAYRISLYES